MTNGYFSPSIVSKYTPARASVPNNTETKTEAAFDKLPTEANIKQGKVTYAVDSGVVDAYVVSLSHAPSAYGDGLLVDVKIGTGNTNTGACTVNVNELGVVAIKNYAGADPEAGDLPAGSVVPMRHNGTNFRIVGAPYAAATATAADVVLTHADVVLTHADVVLTNADVVTTGNNVTSAQAAQTAAEAAANGIYWKVPAVVATVANITLSGEQTLDGVLTSASRVLVTGQTASEENGVYVTASGAWVRATPLDTWDEHIGAALNVTQGTVYADTEWLCTVDPGGTLGTTAITWVQRPAGDMKKADNLSGLASAAAAFSNIKQAATTTATGVVEIATTAEAQAGVAATVPDCAGVAAAIAALGSGTTAASQTEMETATSTAVYSSPGRQHFHPGHPKAWVAFNGTGTVAIEQDYGVTSITDNGTGDYTVNFDTNFSAATYAHVANCDRAVGTTHGTEGIQVVSRAVGAFRFICASAVPTPTDQELVTAAFFGDQ